MCGRQILVGQDGHSVRAFVAGRCDSCEEWDVALGKTVFAELADMNENDDGLNAEPPINVRVSFLFFFLWFLTPIVA